MGMRTAITLADFVWSDSPDFRETAQHVVDAERLQADLEHLNEAEGPAFKIEQDPRCTRLGRWLRRLSLDEVRSFATLLQQSKELGTSLSGALRVFSDEMRHKRMSLAEEKAHALPAKMSVPVTVCILPVVLMVAIIPVIVKMTAE